MSSKNKVQYISTHTVKGKQRDKAMLLRRNIHIDESFEAYEYIRTCRHEIYKQLQRVTA